jgi:hypothetical protein
MNVLKISIQSVSRPKFQQGPFDFHITCPVSNYAGSRTALWRPKSVIGRSGIIGAACYLQGGLGFRMTDWCVQCQKDKLRVPLNFKKAHT